MKKQKKVLPDEFLKVIVELLKRYNLTNQYIEKELLGKKMLSTNQIVTKYCVTRHTVYRLCRTDLLTRITTNRSHYFDAEKTHQFFQTYRKN